MKKDKYDTQYRLFSKVILTYFVKDFRNFTGCKISYDIEDISYLNPVFIEKEKYNICIKNNIKKILYFHENIRFLLRESDMLVIEGILSKKGYNDTKNIILKLFSKTAIGMSIISKKNIPKIFYIENNINVYNLGYQDKFLSFVYIIDVEGFPQFKMIQIVHEAVIEKFNRKFLQVINLEIPFIELARFLLEPFFYIFNTLVEGTFYFYPERIEIKENIVINNKKDQNIISLLMKKNDLLFPFIIIFSNNIVTKKHNEYINNLICKIENIYNNNNSLKYTMPFNIIIDKNNNIKNNILKIGVVIQTYFEIKNGIEEKISFIFSKEIINALTFAIYKKKIKNFNKDKLYQYLIYLNNYISKFYLNKLPKFRVPPKEQLKLDVEYEEKLIVKKNIIKKIKNIDGIIKIDNKIIQLALSKLKQKEIIIILKSITKNTRCKILENMSERTKDYYKKEIDVPIKIKLYQQKAYIAKLINTINIILNSF